MMRGHSAVVITKETIMSIGAILPSAFPASLGTVSPPVKSNTEESSESPAQKATENEGSENNIGSTGLNVLA
jgi:hypothetical protein